MDLSTEVKQLTTGFYAAASHGDFELLNKLVSRRTGVLWIGTDPDEWWQSPEAIFDAWRMQTAELGAPFRITDGNPTVHQHGDVAWVSDRPTIQLPDGTRLPFRFTAVWLREPEGWRIVQVHSSFGVLFQTPRVENHGISPGVQ